MRNAQEKALKLLQNHYKITYKDNRSFDFDLALSKHLHRIKAGLKGLDSIIRAKECTLLTIDEIIEAENFTLNHFKEFFSGLSPVFWQNVRKEIEKY